MLTMTEKIVDFINMNRMSTTEVADALNKSVELALDLKPIVPGLCVAGVVYYVPAVNGSNWHVHKYIREIPKNSVVFIDVENCGDKAIIGGLVAKYTFFYRQAKGIIVTGKVRDAQELIKQKYPIWTSGFTPIGVEKNEVDLDLASYQRKKEYYTGSVIVADDCGVILIPKERLTEQLLENLYFIKSQEEIWFNCIEVLKWDTFDTVCLKKYKSIP